MIIKTAKYVQSCGNVQQCPGTDTPEIAFIGRSNVGKSSLINMLTNNKKLAHTSGTPGKTQCINHFMINDSWFLVDLPGYGYAKVSKVKRAIFSKVIQDYLTKRKNLKCVFVLIDSRIEPQAIDLEFIQWLGSKSIPFAIAFTKSDKLGKNQLIQNVALFKRALKETWAELPYMIITSATEKTGQQELLEFAENSIKE